MPKKRWRETGREQVVVCETRQTVDLFRRGKPDTSIKRNEQGCAVTRYHDALLPDLDNRIRTNRISRRVELIIHHRQGTLLRPHDALHGQLSGESGRADHPPLRVNERFQWVAAKDGVVPASLLLQRLRRVHGLRELIRGLLVALR